MLDSVRLQRLRRRGFSVRPDMTIEYSAALIQVFSHPLQYSAGKKSQCTQRVTRRTETLSTLFTCATKDKCSLSIPYELESQLSQLLKWRCEAI